MSFLTGKPQKSESKNLSYDYLKNAYGGSVGEGASGMSTMAQILGGGSGGNQALQDYYNNSGGKFQLEQGLDAVNGKFASMGLSKSGAAMKAMENYRSDLASAKLDNFLGNLAKLGALGQGAGGLIANAGQVSKGSGATEGMGSTIGTALSLAAMFSDPLLKTNVVALNSTIGGVPAIAFDYRQGTGLDLPQGRFVGVSADEVARLRPDALGPVVQGYATVDYNRLRAA